MMMETRHERDEEDHPDREEARSDDAGFMHLPIVANSNTIRKPAVPLTSELIIGL
jgi:hypothetical protein